MTPLSRCTAALSRCAAVLSRCAAVRSIMHNGNIVGSPTMSGEALPTPGWRHCGVGICADSRPAPGFWWNRAVGTAVLFLCVLLAGCRSDPVTVRQYVLAPSRPAGEGAADPTGSAPSIALERVRTNPLANQDRILLRGGPGGREVRWLEDGSARWALLPGDMVFEMVLKELREGDRFGRVVIAGQRSADWVLRLELATLEVVVDEAGAARAECELEAVLVRHTPGATPGKESEVAWTGRRSASAPLADRSTDAAVAALSSAFEQALRPPGGILAEVYARTRAPVAAEGKPDVEARPEAPAGPEPPVQ